MYLALDLSTKSSGWSVFDDKGQLVEYGCITSSASSVEKRIGIMRNGIAELLIKYNIKKIFAEQVPDNFSNTTYRSLTWLQGCIMVMVYEVSPKTEVEFLYPSSWRSLLGIRTGRGIKRAEEKKLDMQYVKEHFGITANDDICDSICIGVAGLKKSAFDWSK